MDTFDGERELAYLTRVVPGEKNIPAMVAIYELVYERGLPLRGLGSAIEVALAEGLTTLDQSAFDLIPETCRIVIADQVARRTRIQRGVQADSSRRGKRYPRRELWRRYNRPHGGTTSY